MRLVYPTNVFQLYLANIVYKFCHNFRQTKNGKCTVADLDLSALSIIISGHRNRCVSGDIDQEFDDGSCCMENRSCQFSLYPSQVTNLYLDTRLQGFTDCKMGNTGGRARFRSFPAVTSELHWTRAVDDLL